MNIHVRSQAKKLKYHVLVDLLHTCIGEFFHIWVLIQYHIFEIRLTVKTRKVTLSKSVHLKNRMLNKQLAID